MNNSQSNISLLKWTILAIFVYFNIGAVCSLLSCCIKIAITLLALPVWTHELTDIFLAIVKYSAYIFLFIHFLKFENKIPDNFPLNKLMIINIIVLPVLFLVNSGLDVLVKVIISKNFSMQFFAEYGMFSSITSYIVSFLNTIMLVVFGIIVLNRRPTSI